MVLRNLRDSAIRFAISQAVHRSSEEFEENESSGPNSSAQFPEVESRHLDESTEPAAATEVEPTAGTAGTESATESEAVMDVEPTAGESYWSRLKAYAGVAASHVAEAIDEGARGVRQGLNEGYQQYCTETFGAGFGDLDRVAVGSAELASLQIAARLCAHLNSPHKVPGRVLDPRRVLSKGTDDRSSCVVGYCPQEHSVYVVFRGTKTAADVLTDLSFVPVPIGDSGVAVPAGMLQRVEAVFTHIIEALWEVTGSLVAPEERRDEPLGLCLCGHSLGGGLAMVLALLLTLRDEGRRLLAGLFGRWGVVTFGAPLALALEDESEEPRPELFRTLRDHAVHVVHQFDPVTRLLGRDGALDFSLLTASSSLKAAREKYHPCGAYLLLHSEGASTLAKGGTHHLRRLGDPADVARYMSAAPPIAYMPWALHDHKMSAYLPKLYEFAEDRPWPSGPVVEEEANLGMATITRSDSGDVDSDWLVFENGDVHEEGTTASPMSPAQRIKKHRHDMGQDHSR